MLFARINWITRVLAAMRGLGPYAALELIVPGGTLIAVSLWAFRHRSWFASHLRSTFAVLMGLGASVVVRGAL